MDFRHGISFPILWNTDETSARERFGLSVALTELDITDVIFFSISAIAKYLYEARDGEHMITAIVCDGERFLCIMDVEEVLGKISEYNKKYEL